MLCYLATLLLYAIAIANIHYTAAAVLHYYITTLLHYYTRYELYNPDNQLDKPNSCRALQYFSIDKWQVKNLREKFKEFADHLQLDGLAAGPARTNLSQGMEGWTGARRNRNRNRNRRRSLRSNDKE